ncbi:hypothetical protein [Cohnella hongkongensis]|uniref:50S ribosomal protein L29 n=1 Tax=Cohnella hongkongensis TaxID=178337 RepID=A0ABV9FHJ8_9BACL
MKNTSVIGLGFVEKLLVGIGPILMGAIGWFIPRLLELLKKLPFLAEARVIELLDSFNPVWVSIICMCIGLIAGILFSLTIYSEALKMRISSEDIHVSKDDQVKQIARANVKAVYADQRQVVVIDQADREWLCELSDIPPSKLKDTFLFHDFPWVDHDPYEPEYKLWKLEDERFNSSANAILYERRNALRDGDKKKAKHLRKDLNELGIFVKDQGEEQYVRSIKQ